MHNYLVLVGVFFFSCTEPDAKSKQQTSAKSLAFDHQQHPSQKKMNPDTLPQEFKGILEKMKNKEALKILCYGNSITYGYHTEREGQVEYPYPAVLQNLLRKHFSNTNIEVWNEGHNGWRSDQALYHLDALVIDQKPDLVLLDFGINDYYCGFTANYFNDLMRSVIQKLKNKKIAVLLLTFTPIHLPAYEQREKSFYEVLVQLAKNEKTAFLDLYQAILKRKVKEKISWEKLLPDDVHFASDKYAWIAEEIFSYFENCIKKL